MYNGAGQVSVYEESACLPTFRATFSNIQNTVAVGTTMGFAALWHTSSSAKRIRIWRVWCTFKSVSTLANLTLQLKRTTTQVPAGGTAVTPAPSDPGDTVDTYTVFQTNNADLWTAGTSPAYAATCADSVYWFRNGAYTTGSTGTAPGWGGGNSLLLYTPGANKPLILRPGVTEGFVLALDTDNGTAVNLGGGFEWTEE